MVGIGYMKVCSPPFVPCVFMRCDNAVGSDSFVHTSHYYDKHVSVASPIPGSVVYNYLVTKIGENWISMCAADSVVRQYKRACFVVSLCPYFSPFLRHYRSHACT